MLSRDEIDTKINEFNNAYTDLKISNGLVGGIGGGTTVFYIMGSLSGWAACIAYLALGVCNYKLLERDKKSKKFREKTEELLAIYQTRIRGTLPPDETTILLLKILAPFIIDSKELIPENYDEKLRAYGESFHRILSAPPHNLRSPFTFAKQESDSYLSKGFSLFKQGYEYARGQSFPLKEADKVIQQLSQRNMPYERLKVDGFQLIFGYEAEENKKMQKKMF